jgi:hypothetical protein
MKALWMGPGVCLSAPRAYPANSYAFARRPGRKSFLKKSAFPSRRGQLRHGRGSNLLPRNTEPSSYPLKEERTRPSEPEDQAQTLFRRKNIRCSMKSLLHSNAATTPGSSYTGLDGRHLKNTRIGIFRRRIGRCRRRLSGAQTRELALERMNPTLDPAPKRRLLLRKRERHKFYSVVLGLDADQDVLPARLFRFSDRVVNFGR